MNKSDFVCISVQDAITPFDGAIVYKDRWWIIENGNILLYRGVSPQCNRDKRVVEKSLQKLYPGSEVKFLETVYLDLLDVFLRDR